jgi:Protein of unknown function (DUF4038)/Domain of unknown function (DUF5060)/Putative collagen-binding domain of a collagenase
MNLSNSPVLFPLSSQLRRWGVASLGLCLAVFSAGAASTTPKWSRFEKSFESSVDYANPVQDATLTTQFISPSGATSQAPGFWDGERTWRIRFAPNQTGKWTWRTTCSDSKNAGLHGQSGEFECIAAAGGTRFDQHGPVRVSDDNRYFIHEDGTPFFWLADTAWNGALLSSTQEWDMYLRERTRQQFTAVQWVGTQFRAAPDGDKNKELAYAGTDKIAINPKFFQRLDEKVEAVNKAGLLNVPVMLWAINGGSNPKVNPGVSLSEDQAILLARYMIARWGANDVAWILAGDSDYRGDKAAKWQRIGRAAFATGRHGPVTLHPGGMQWYWDEFRDEKWFDFIGYQSGHGDDDKTIRWLIEGPPTEDWMKLPHRPFINLEPPYENHVAYQSRKPHPPESVRRAVYWSLLDAPTAGVTYGGHGVWGWDDGSKPPTDHPGTGTPLPWEKALKMPAAEQMKHLFNYFTSVDFWRLRPLPMAVVNQPGKDNPSHYIAAARTEQKDLLVLYVPEDRTVEVKMDILPPSPNVTWFNPRTGETNTAVGVVTVNTVQFPTPSEGDWILQLKSAEKK